MHRATAYKLLGIGRRACGWDEAHYRARLAAHGATPVAGRVSATSMSLAQMTAVLDEMAQHGFAWRPRGGAGPGTQLRVTPWRARAIGKLNKLWCLLADAGFVRNRSEQAMHAWCQARVPGLTRLEWASASQLRTATEELKAWAMRLGYTEDAAGYLNRPGPLRERARP